MEKKDSRHLFNKVRLQLLEAIQSGVFSHASRLPPENELAEYFGVSRNMIRECLTQLEQEGMVNRRRGVGTLINRRIVSTENRLDLVASLDSTLLKAGYIPSTDSVHLAVKPAEGEAAENLEVRPGSPLLVVERRILASGTPAVHVTDYIPMANLPRNIYTKQDVMPSIFTFLQSEANTEVYLNLAELRAVAAPGKVAEALQIQEGAPLLFLAEVGFSFDGIPVLYSEEYLADRVIRQTILRKKI